MPILKSFCKASDLKITVEHLQKSEIECLKYLNYKLDLINSHYFINIFLINGIVFSSEFNDEKAFSNETGKISGDSTQAVPGGNSRSNMIINEYYNKQFSFHRKSYSCSETSQPLNKNINNDANTVIENQNNQMINKKTEQIYSLCLEIHSLTFEDSGYYDYSPLNVACSCVALSRKMIKLKDRWPKMLENFYEIKFTEFKDSYEFVKKVFYNSKKTKSKEKEIIEPTKNESNKREKLNISGAPSKYTSDFKSLLTSNQSTKNKLDKPESQLDIKVSQINQPAYEKIDSNNTNNGNSTSNTANTYHKLTTEKIKEKVSKLRIMLNNNDEETVKNKKDLITHEAITSKHKRSESSINKTLESFLTNPNFKLTLSEEINIISKVNTQGENILQKSLSNLNSGGSNSINPLNNASNYNSINDKNNSKLLINKYRENKHQRNTSITYQATSNNYINQASQPNLSEQNKNQSNQDTYRYLDQKSKNDIIEKTRKMFEQNSSIINNYKKINSGISSSLTSKSSTYIEYNEYNKSANSSKGYLDNNNVTNDLLKARDKLNLHDLYESSHNSHSSTTNNDTHSKYNDYSLKYDSYKNNTKTIYDNNLQHDLYSSRESVKSSQTGQYGGGMISREYHKSSFSMLKKLNDNNTKTNFDYSKNYSRDYHSNNIIKY